MGQERGIRTTTQTLAGDRAIGRTSAQNRQLKWRIFRRLLKTPKKRSLRLGLLIVHAALLVLITFMVINSQNGSAGIKQSAILSTANSANSTRALDHLSSADIAVHVARVTRLEESTAVTNYADTVNAQLSLSSTEENVVAKPQIPAVGLKTRKDITTYVTVQGDTIASVAAKFGVTSDTIRWSNNLIGSNLSAGTELVISPINGIVYTVRTGDTIDSIARKYNANKEALIAFNDAELTGSFKVGERIVIPGGIVLAAPSATYFGFKPTFGYNGYDYGYCTWWAATRRAQIGRPVPANFGHACRWAGNARAAGIPVRSTPIAGAVIWSKSGCLGHVGFVEFVNEDGSIWVTDMNSRGQRSQDDPTPAGGWNRVSWRRVTPDQFGKYEFIY